MTHNFPTRNLDFGGALDLLVGGGYRVCRAGWNGKGSWLKLVTPDEYSVDDSGGGSTEVASFKKDGTLTRAHYGLLPWIGMKTADNKFVPWLASQTDILADDWELVE